MALQFIKEMSRYATAAALTGTVFVQQKAHFLEPGREHSEIYFDSGDYGWATKNIAIRFLCADSKKGQETVRIDHFTLTESEREAVYHPLMFQEASYIDGSDQDAHRYFPRGMSASETDFAWTEGTDVQCRFSLAEEGAGDFQLRLGLLGVYHARQRFRVTCENQVLYETVISDAETPVDIPIPADCVHKGKVSLTLHCPDAVPRLPLGESEDGRELAFAFKFIELVK